MNQIGILICNKLTYQCAATRCFNAFINKEDAFEQYQDENVALGAVFIAMVFQNFKKEMDYKLVQLRKSNIEIVHLARCVQVECNRYEELKEGLVSEGFIAIDGSHA